IEDHDGRVIACPYPGGLVQFSEGRIAPILKSRRPPFDRIGGRILRSRDGQWWIATDLGPGGGVFRFREPTLQLDHGERLLSAAGIGAAYISYMYEDAEGQIWVAASNGDLYRFDPARRAPPFSERIALELPRGERLQPETSPNHHFVRAMIGDG